MIGVVILVALIRLHIQTRNAWLCAGLFTGCSALFSLLQEMPFAGRIVVIILNIGLSYLFFRLLTHFEDSRGAWWMTIIAFVTFPIILSLTA
jgi:hypothetical protein